MSKSIWDASLDPNENVRQNTFDWTHTNNLTSQIGRLTPVLCELVPAKTSFRVDPSMALQCMPMVFPIQSRMRASISYFRYPLRALWSDYKDFQGNFRPNLEEPYINFNSANKLNKMAKTGTLGDYLGLPSTRVGSYGSDVNMAIYSSSQLNSDNIWYILPQINGRPYDGFLSGLSPSAATSCLAGRNYGYVFNPSSVLSIQEYNIKFVFDIEDLDPAVVQATLSNCDPVICYIGSGSPSDTPQVVSDPLLVSTDGDTIIISGSFTPSIVSSPGFLSLVFPTTNSLGIAVDLSAHYAAIKSIVSLSEATLTSVEGDTIEELTLATSPYYNSNSGDKERQIKISAYAFRAYEGIYNSTYRDIRNNPYYINGEVQYNQWIPSYDGGEDNNVYELRYANWEKDFLTTAVQSPQQGNAPLVGLTTYETGETLENGNLETKVALVDESGQRYSLEFESSDEGLENVKYVELENGTSVRSARSLMDLATAGISIPDLRMVNCYQKFLELNMRKGYSYKQIIEGRFDVKVKYADLLLPEFFGGFSRDMNMNAISQTTDQDTNSQGLYKDALGAQAGVAYFNGSSGANIECFCDEESIIMGILCITPLPVYTQLLPKHFLYRGLLDHFNPEFNNIGFQPISYKEVCPIQAYNANKDSLNLTFGYQRPWYEYCQRYDTAHGLFRTDLSNFLMHRVFQKQPQLAKSFLLVDPDQVTDVFAVTETTDKIYGQIRQQITVKLPVSRVAIPRLD